MHRHGCPDIVIANAGSAARTFTAFAEDNEVFEDILATNVLGMVISFIPLWPAMQGNGTWQPGWHCERRGVSRSSGRRCLLGFQSRRYQLSWRACV